MISSLKKQICIAILSVVFISCGTNTDTPVAPFVFLVPVAVPQIFTVLPSTSNVNADGTIVGSPSLSAKPDYFLHYFVTNREPQFVGYNLYISTTTPSLAETLAGEYLEDGIPPSFAHLPIENSTEANKVVIRKIKNFAPPPGLVPFQQCLVYTFTLRSLLNSGLVSNQSTPVSKCSSIRPNFCEVGSGCNSLACSVPNCSSPSSCPVGTNCNPCNYPGTEEFGCQCPAGVDPPGCNR
ncbi:LIC11073 family putative lipoprotein [Leptospira sp. GIMC2001]|uniref:LIC11073 family putative lipoprotein n=1 Tax=Leptospira sp. GIMC2001 TaxID=1513297 RepID=UPI00234BCB3F|nr:hypothetical protein [Leptospira sp. GIMC2001]WCL48568.1 hypothetical protein O4O04_14835 [Leptospira sp. GIMC2001]